MRGWWRARPSTASSAATGRCSTSRLLSATMLTMLSHVRSRPASLDPFPLERSLRTTEQHWQLGEEGWPQLLGWYNSRWPYIYIWVTSPYLWGASLPEQIGLEKLTGANQPTNYDLTRRGTILLMRASVRAPERARTHVCHTERLWSVDHPWPWLGSGWSGWEGMPGRVWQDATIHATSIYRLVVTIFLWNISCCFVKYICYQLCTVVWLQV